MSTQNDQRDYINDYSLLRPFNANEAKIGDKFIWITTECEFLGVSDHKGYLRVEHKDGLSYVTNTEAFEKPLAWVEGKPVYKGDVLYATDGLHEGKFVVANGNLVRVRLWGSFLPIESNTSDEAKANIDYLTWNKPKVKKEGWINIYKNGTVYLHNTEEDAIKGDIKFRSNWDHAPDFVTTVRIEYEV